MYLGVLFDSNLTLNEYVKNFYLDKIFLTLNSATAHILSGLAPTPEVMTFQFVSFLFFSHFILLVYISFLFRVSSLLVCVCFPSPVINCPAQMFHTCV